MHKEASVCAHAGVAEGFQRGLESVPCGSGKIDRLVRVAYHWSTAWQQRLTPEEDISVSDGDGVESGLRLFSRKGAVRRAPPEVPTMEAIE